MHHIANDEGVDTSYIHQIKSNWRSISMPPLPWLHILITSGQGTGIFVADRFIHCWTVDVDCMPEMLLNSIVIGCQFNHLQQVTLSIIWN